MSYKKGMSKGRYKRHLRLFWTDKWKYERTPEEWVGIIKGDFMNHHTNSSHKWFGGGDSSYYMTQQKTLLYDAIDKLILEKKLQKKDETRLKEMIESPDRENAILAITIMATVKPKKFKQVKPETHE